AAPPPAPASSPAPPVAHTEPPPVPEAPPAPYDRGDEVAELSELPALPRPAAPPAADREPRVAMRSTHVERLRRFLESQRELETHVSGLLERETAPVREILQRYDQAMARLEAAADAQLGPLQEFARGEEANLETLIAKMKAEGAAAYRASLPYFERSRDRLAETYRRIDHHRLPVLE